MRLPLLALQSARVLVINTDSAVASCCGPVLSSSQHIRRWFTFTQLDGSVRKFVQFASHEGLQGLWQAWPQPSLEAWTILLAFGSFEALLQRYAPGKTFEGPITPHGNTPVYKVMILPNSKSGFVQLPFLASAYELHSLRHTSVLFSCDTVCRLTVSPAISSHWRHSLSPGGKLHQGLSLVTTTSVFIPHAGGL